MIKQQKWIILPTSLTLLIFSLVLAKERPTRTDPTFFRPKQVQAVTQNALNYLSKHESDGKVKVWVFFTDKGIYNKQQMESAALAAKAGFTERALARRVKHGVGEVRFSDLPVNSKYVDLITGTGAKLRQVSKWLNGASFEVEPAKLGLIGKFPFVERIQPVALFKKSYDKTEPIDSPSKSETPIGPEGLLYGSSLGQLSQINVPNCHDSGYAGAGVIISMFDSGFRTTHNSFANIRTQQRLLAQYDFIFHDSVVDNQGNDDPGAWSHGTSTWSTCGGENPGTHYGPAYQASFILCKTEDIRSETPIEEDNWLRAMEWVDSIGTDIISSSLGYTDWYVPSQYNGSTCVTTLAADTATVHGILVCNSAGNSGPGASTLGAPADAFDILTVGAVGASGTIASFSSRGPTADGRTKPEVCAQGVSDYLASSSSDAAYGYGSGTSFSCPLTAGVAAVVMSAHPTWTNLQVREAMMNTGSRASTPDNTYGWGILNAWAAIHYSFGPQPCLPGDANADCAVDISDAVYLVDYIFGGGPAPIPPEAGDTDCSSGIDIADAVYLINYIFGGGPAPC